MQLANAVRSHSAIGLFQFISAPPCQGTPFFSTPSMEFPTAFLLHSMEFPTQVNHPPMEFLTLFTLLPWNFQHYVSILNPLLEISSPKIPPSMEFSIWKKMPSPKEFSGSSTGGCGYKLE